MRGGLKGLGGLGLGGGGGGGGLGRLRAPTINGEDRGSGRIELLNLYILKPLNLQTTKPLKPLNPARLGETWEGLGRQSGGYSGFRSNGFAEAWGSTGAEGDWRMLHLNECEACKSS